MARIVYLWDRYSRMFLGSTYAQPNIARPGEYIMPAFSTDEPPPLNMEPSQSAYRDKDNLTWEVGPTSEPAFEELHAQYTEAVQMYLDDFARTRNFDNILSAATYATSTVPKFRAEGQYAVEARDLTWAKGYEILDEVMSGQRPMPDLDDVLAELPILAWPE